MLPPTCPAVVEALADAVEVSADGVGASTAAAETSAMLLCRGEVAKMEGVGGMVGWWSFIGLSRPTGASVRRVASV